MHLYRRADSPVWWVAFTLDSRRLRRSTRETGKTAARLSATRIIAEERQRQPVAGAWRLSHLAGTWLDSHGRHRADCSTVTYQLGNLVRLLGGTTLVRDLAAADVIAYRARRKEEGVGNASINRELSLLRAALRWADMHHEQPMPKGLRHWQGLFLKEPAPRLRALMPAEYQALLAAADEEMRAIILVAVLTGLRRENIRQLEWHQVDLLQGRVTVEAKGGKRIVARLTGPAVAALARTPPEARRGRIFGKPNWRRRWESAKQAAGLPDFRFHDLRHTFAAWARHAGIDIADLQAAMGHADIATTMRYAQLLPLDRRSAFDAAAEALTAFTAPSDKQRRA